MKRTQSETPLRDVRAAQTDARLVHSQPEQDSTQHIRTSERVAAAVNQASPFPGTITSQPELNQPVQRPTSAEHLKVMAPSSHHDAYLQWTSARAAGTLARWRELFQWDAATAYPNKSVLFSQGDEATSTFLVARGIVKLMYSSSDGCQHLLGLRYPGDLIGDWWLNLTRRCPFSAVTALPAEIHRIDSARIRDAAMHDHNARHLQVETLQRDLCSLAEKYLALKGLTPTAFLERLLWELASVVGSSVSSGAARLVLPFTNAEMADLCGLSESHYKEVRRELEQSGKVKHPARRLWLLRIGKGMVPR